MPASRTEHGVERPQALGAALGLRQAIDVAEQRIRLGGRSELDQRDRREGGVAQPAVAVVPVAHAADLLRQARGRGGHDGTRRLMAEGTQGQRAALDLGPRERRKTQALEPAAPCLLRALAALGLGRGVGREAVAAAAQLDHVGPVAHDVRSGARVHAVVLDLPLEPRRVERDGIGSAQHDDAVGLGAQADRSAAEVGSRRELEDRLGAALEHAHEADAAVGLAAVEVIAHASGPPSGSRA